MSLRLPHDYRVRNNVCTPLGILCLINFRQVIIVLIERIQASITQLFVYSVQRRRGAYHCYSYLGLHALR